MGLYHRDRLGSVRSGHRVQRLRYQICRGGEVPSGSLRHCTIDVYPEHEAEHAPQKAMVTTHAATPAGKFKPQDHYIDFVIAGIKHWNLPQECIDWWEDQRPRR